MIKEVFLSFTNSKNQTLILSSKEVDFDYKAQENQTSNFVNINIYNASAGFFHWLKPVIPKGKDLYENTNLIFVSATVKYEGGASSEVFSNAIENVYQQIHTPPDSILSILTTPSLYSKWIDTPLKTPLNAKRMSFKTACQRSLGKYMGEFNIKDFTVRGTYYRKLSVVKSNQIDSRGLSTNFKISYKNGKVNFYQSSTKKMVNITVENGLRSVPTLNVSPNGYVNELLTEQQYYQVQFNTVHGLYNIGQNVKVKDFRALTRKGYIDMITRSFHTRNGGFDAVMMREGTYA